MNNSLTEVHPELVSEWSEKNKIKPTEVSIGSHKKVIWRCEKGHEWEAAVKSRTINKTGWAYCFVSHICGENREHSSQICLFFNPLLQNVNCKCVTNIMQARSLPFFTMWNTCNFQISTISLIYSHGTDHGLVRGEKEKVTVFFPSDFICIGDTSFFHGIW